MRVMEPQIRYARTSDDASIAYAQAGDGPDLVCVPFITLTHTKLVWSKPWSIQAQLAEYFRVLHYDSRGSGMSQRDATDFSLEAMVRDAEAAIDAAGLDCFVLFGYWDGGPVAMKYAVEHPDRVSHLVLADTAAAHSDYPEEGAIEMEKATRNMDWVLFTNMMARVLTGFDDIETADDFAEYLRACLTADVWRAKEEAIADWDVRPDLPRIKAPTLVFHLTTNTWLPVEAAQRLAAAIPDSRLVLSDKKVSYEEFPPIIAEFCGLAAKPAPAEASTFRTILFTDIEGSTALTERLGDAAAREVLREHERITREALNEHGGSEVKTMGDGFMASFGSATKALECAVAMQLAFGDGDVRVRIGLNAGEPIAEDDDLSRHGRHRRRAHRRTGAGRARSWSRTSSGNSWRARASCSTTAASTRSRDSKTRCGCSRYDGRRP